MGKMGVWEILLIVILVLILFGHAKIPELMKNLADGINVFKKELKNNGGASVSEKSQNNTTVNKSVKSMPKKSTSVKKSVKKVAKK